MALARKQLTQIDGRLACLDSETGEVTGLAATSGCFVYHAEKARLKERFAMIFQNALVRLAKLRLTQYQSSVFHYLLGTMEFENFCLVSQKQIAADLGIARPHVSTAMKQLVSLGLLTCGPQVGNNKSYRVSPDFCWKGNIIALQKTLALPKS